MEAEDFFLTKKRADKIKKANARLAEESDDENQPLSDDEDSNDDDDMESSANEEMSQEDDVDSEFDENNGTESDMNENDSNSEEDASDVNMNSEGEELDDDLEDEVKVVKSKEEIEDEKLALKLKKKGKLGKFSSLFYFILFFSNF